MNEDRQELFFFQDQKRNGRFQKKWIVLLVVGLFLLAGAVFLFTRNRVQAPSIDQNTFIEGVSVYDVVLSGRTFDEGKRLVEERMSQQITQYSLHYTVDAEEYTITSEQAKLTANCEEALADAFACAKSADAEADQQTVKYAKTSGICFYPQISADETAIEEAIVKQQEKSAEMQPLKLTKKSDEESLVTSYQVSFSEVTVKELDTKTLAAEIAEQMCVFGKETLSAVTTKQTAVTKEQAKEGFRLIGEYSTTISRPELDSAYNIWKGADLLNATVIGPAESWSMKKALGALTQEVGWKTAAELVNGASTKTLGGGLNHLASTVYAAALTAKLKVSQRVQRPWAASYIDIGLEADIFSDDADLVIINNRPEAIYLIIEMDGGSGKLTVRFYGKAAETAAVPEVKSERSEKRDESGRYLVRVYLERKETATTEDLYTAYYQKTQ